MAVFRRARLLLLAGLFIVAWATLAAWAFSTGSSSEASGTGDAAGEAPGGHGGSHDAAAREGNKPKRTLPFIEAVPAFDTSDPRRLIGFSENVFTGRVVRKVSEVPLESTIPGSEGAPHVQFLVTAGRVIKSSGAMSLVEGYEAIVEQMGGTDPATGETYRIETVTGGEHYTDTILEPGNEYLFATRYDRVRGFHTITAQPHGDVPLTDNPEGRATLELYERAAEDQVSPLKHASEAPGETP